MRFGDEVECGKCGKIGKFYRLSKEPAYSCPRCGHHIHPMVGTPFEKTHTPLQKWFYAMYLFTTTRHGVAAKELQRQLGVTYKTAWRMGHLIRKHMADTDGEWQLVGTVEVDETYVGGKRSGGKRGRGAPGKTVVFGMLERDGDVMAKVVPKQLAIRRISPRPRSSRPNSNPPASDVMIPPSNPATTLCRSTGSNSNNVGLHSVCIGASLELR